MGGHGGLNILPQKTWNVYRQDNQAKVKRDEEFLAQARETRLAEEASSRMQSLKAGEGNSMAAPSMANKRKHHEREHDSRQMNDCSLTDEQIFKRAKK